MAPRLFILGAGGHGKVCAEVALAMDFYREIVFLDDEVPAGCKVLDFTVLGKISALARLREPGDQAFIAIGDNRRRREVFEFSRSCPVATLRHPSAIISRYAKIGDGVLLMPRVVVNAGASIGEGAIVNTGAIVEHDCQVAAFVHLSPGVCLAGGARVGEAAHLGVGAIVLPNVAVGEGSIAGAGCVVNKDLPSDVVAVGLPARIIHADSTFQSEHYRPRERVSARGPLQPPALLRQQAD
jgi:sugar O-acyltransferase (sialic acid O-acetyltransferase NeuD family)